MDAEKSSNSSFEDLSNLNEAEIKTADAATSALIFDDEGNSIQSTSSLDSENSNFITKTSYTHLNSMSNIVKSETNKLISSEGGKPNAGGTSTTEPIPSNSTFIQSEGGTKSVAGGAWTAESPGVSSSQSENNVGDPIGKESMPEKAEAESADDDLVCDVLGNGQLVKTVITKSTIQMRPKRGDLVTINYIGKLEDGTTVEEAKNFQMHVGDYEVVQGLDMIIPLMDLNEVASVDIDARFAYGSLGVKNEKPLDKVWSVPPNESLVYTVELLDIKEEDFSDLKSFDVRRKYGTRKKERANFWYNRNEYNIAIQLYRRALDYLDDRDGDPDALFEKEDLELSNADLQTLLEDRLIVYNNMAMAQIKISAFDAALKSVENVLRCQPNNSKALYRKGRILEGKGDVKGAISLLQKAATLEPESKTIQQDLAKLIIKARREEHNEKELYQKMLGQAKKLEMKNKQPQKQQTTQNSKAKLLGYLMGSILIGVAGVAIYRYKY